MEVYILDLTKISQRVYILACQPETGRPTIGYIKGNKHTFMIEAGNSAAHVAQFNGLLSELNFKLPDYVAVTHAHWDHSYGMHAVKGKSIACKITNDILTVMASWEWTESAMKERLSTGEEVEYTNDGVCSEYEDFKNIKVVPADIVFKNELEIDLGDVTVVLKNIISPHTEDSVIAYIPEEKVVFIGDAYCKDCYIGSVDDPVKIKKLIDTLQNLEFDICVLGHTKPLKKDVIIRFLNSQYRKISH